MSRRGSDLAVELADHEDDRVRDLAQAYRHLLSVHLSGEKERREAWDKFSTEVFRLKRRFYGEE